MRLIVGFLGRAFGSGLAEWVMVALARIVGSARCSDGSSLAQHKGVFQARWEVVRGGCEVSVASKLVRSFRWLCD